MSGPPVIKAVVEAKAAPGVDISGTWALTSTVLKDAANRTCTFKQTGALLTGTCVGQPATGEVVGMIVTFQYNIPQADQDLVYAFSGTVAAGGAAIEGEVRSLLGSITKFSATKQ